MGRPESLAKFVNKCVAFPCQPELLSNALATLSQAGSLKTVYYWRQRQYCLCQFTYGTTHLKSNLARTQTRGWRECSHLWPFAFLSRVKPTNQNFDSFHKTIHVREPLSVKKIVHHLSLYSSLSAQISTLEELMKPTMPDFLLRLLYADSVKQLLASTMRHSNVEVFGSLRSGLMTIEGDLDLSVSFSDPLYHNLNDKVREMIKKTDKPLIKLLRLLRMVDHNIVRNYSLVHARVPLICLHHRAGFSIDISEQDVLLRNTQHISTLLSAIVDFSICPEFRPLSLFLKWFLRHQEFVQFTNNLSGFKVTMLVIHFLQRQKLMPPLQPLMDELAINGVVPVTFSRRLQPELLGELFRDMLIYLTELFSNGRFDFDLRSGKWNVNEGQPRLVCLEPYNSNDDMLRFTPKTLQMLKECCGILSDALRDRQCFRPEAIFDPSKQRAT